MRRTGRTAPWPRDRATTFPPWQRERALTVGVDVYSSACAAPIGRPSCQWSVARAALELVSSSCHDRDTETGRCMASRFIENTQPPQQQLHSGLQIKHTVKCVCPIRDQSKGRVSYSGFWFAKTVANQILIRYILAPCDFTPPTGVLYKINSHIAIFFGSLCPPETSVQFTLSSSAC